MKTVFQHPKYGPVTLRKTRRSRRLTVSVRPPGTVSLSVPVRVPVSKALDFMESRAEWIQKALDNYKTKFPVFIFTESFSTGRHTLKFVSGGDGNAKASVSKDVINVAVPEGYKSDCPEVQAAAKAGVEEALRVEAREYLPQRTMELARIHGFLPGKVTVRKSVSRWGSCSSDNNISLSIHLMRLPRELADYVIIHELCHTLEKNHGPVFHRLLDHHTGGRHRELRRQLSAFSPRW